VVARGASREDVIHAIAHEIGLLVGVEEILMMRYEDDHHATVLATAVPLDTFPPGSRLRLGGENVATRVKETGEPARIDDFGEASGLIGQRARQVGVRSAVGTPVVVEGRPWGVLVTGTHEERPLPADTGARVSEFTDLMGTAIANTKSQLRAIRAHVIDERTYGEIARSQGSQRWSCASASAAAWPPSASEWDRAHERRLLHPPRTAVGGR
jgi:GAF domain-containing protein